MERIPRAEGEAFISSPVPGVEEKARYDVNERFEVGPEAATATQVTLMFNMLPERLVPYRDSLDIETRDLIFTKWIDRYGDHFGRMIQELGKKDNFLDHLKNQSISDAEQGRTSFTGEEIEKMIVFLESALPELEVLKGPLLTQEEIADIIKKHVH